MFKNLIIIIGLLSVVPASAASFEEYVVLISSQCPDTNRLIIKKTLIELNRDRSCSNTFTAILLKQCTNISCASLVSISEAFSGSNSGSIIGR